jgi:hypothetical protein
MDWQSDLGTRFKTRTPASDSDMTRTSEALSFALPDDYREFLNRYSDGGEGRVGDSYLVLWSVADLQELNDAYSVAEFAPGLVLIGTDGGGEGIGFDTRRTTPPVVSVPLVGMSLNDARVLARSFTEFLQKLVK